MMSNPESDIKRFAMMARAALICRVCDQKTLVEYVDSWIAKLDQPDPLLIDLSISPLNDINGVIHILHEYLNELDRPEVGPFLAIIAEQYFAKLITRKQATTRMYLLIFNTNMSIDEENSIRNIELNFEDFTPTSDDEALAELEDFLSLYKDIVIPELFILP